MKRTFKKTIASVLALLLAFGLVACSDGGDGFTDYSNGGLEYELPDSFGEIDVNYADYAYTSKEFPGLEVMMYFYSTEQLISDIYLKSSSTVKEYADWFVHQNGYVGVEEDYDEEEKKIVLKYFYEDGSESYFFYDYIVRNEYMLYHVTFACNPDDREAYEPSFEEWTSRISMIY